METRTSEYETHFNRALEERGKKIDGPNQPSVSRAQYVRGSWACDVYLCEAYLMVMRLARTLSLSQHASRRIYTHKIHKMEIHHSIDIFVSKLRCVCIYLPPGCYIYIRSHAEVFNYKLSATTYYTGISLFPPILVVDFSW